MGTVVTIATSLGALFFVDSGSGLVWFATLVKPALVPPEWTFALIWVALYVLMTFALAVVWTTQQSPEREGWVRFYFIQILFITMWVIFLFGLHSILISFIDMLFSAFIISALIASAWEIDRRASYLLAPCFACALFFAYLNLIIWFMN